MANWIKKSVNTFSEKGGIFTFLRAQLSSQLASITDFGVTIILAKVADMYYVYSTFTGSVCGGIVNCIINYRWTFKAQGQNKKHIAIKYVMVWVCSILLNTSGTYALTELLGKIVWLRELLGTMFDDIFIVSKVIVSLLVGWIWNFNMQRLFVYKDRNYKKYLDKVYKTSDDRDSEKEG